MTAEAERACSGGKDYAAAVFYLHNHNLGKEGTWRLGILIP